MNLYIFHRDLRITDNKVLPCFIFIPSQLKDGSDNCIQIMIECLQRLDNLLFMVKFWK